MTKILATDDIVKTAAEGIKSLDADRVILLTDSNVARCQGVLVERLTEALTAMRIIVAAGEEHKNLATVTEIWDRLVEMGTTRRSVMVCLGGGVVTDMGGFAAACFKRGIRFVNIPTTLLGAVDAAVGGKTGVDFNGLKNEIGAFADAEMVIVSTEPYSTLPETEILSGYAEIVKTALITPPDAPGIEPDWYQRLLDIDNVLGDGETLRRMVLSSIKAKQRVVEIDPREKGIRKALNFGHTIGHAYESIALEDGEPIAHGIAVAHGMMRALEMSVEYSGLPASVAEEYKERILSRYPGLPEGCGDKERVAEYMRHDKKNNIPGKISYTLLSSPGYPMVDFNLPI